MREILFTSSGVLPGYETGGHLSNGVLEVYMAELWEPVVRDPDGRLVIAPMSQSGSSVLIDLSDWSLTGTWTVFSIEVQPGEDGPDGISEDDFLSIMTMTSSRSKNCSRMIAFPVLAPNIQDVPVAGTHFYASGKEQWIHKQKIEVIIPATGAGRQWVGGTQISRESFHHFQVMDGLDLIWDVILDSVDFHSSSNKGEKFIFPSLLPALSPTGERKTYLWKMRVSFKEMLDGEYVWSEWSETFQFKVNLPPGIPQNLEVH